MSKILDDTRNQLRTKSQSDYVQQKQELKKLHKDIEDKLDHSHNQTPTILTQRLKDLELNDTFYQNQNNCKFEENLRDFLKYKKIGEAYLDSPEIAENFRRKIVENRDFVRELEIQKEMRLLNMKVTELESEQEIESDAENVNNQPPGQPKTPPTKFINAPSEIWSSRRTNQLLANKFIVIMGDSIQRCAYKDLVCLLHNDLHCEEEDFTNLHEDHFMGDCMIDASQEDKRDNTFSYYQIRQYYSKESNTLIRFYFITKIWSHYMRYIFEHDFSERAPDVIVCNSMLYDISAHHYGLDSEARYIPNLTTFHKMCVYFNIPCIFRSSLPLGLNAHGGVLQPVKEIQTSKGTVLHIKKEIVEMNKLVEKYATINGGFGANLTFLNCDPYFTRILDERGSDDLHWSPYAHRLLTFLTLTEMRRSVFCVPRVPWDMDFKDLQCMTKFRGFGERKKKPKNKRPNERKSREEGEITLSSTEDESRESRQDLLDYFDSSSASEDSSDDDNNEDRNPDSKLKPKLSTKHQRKLQNQEALFQKFAHILKQAKEKSVKYKDYQGEDYFQTCHMIVPEARIPELNTIMGMELKESNDFQWEYKNFLKKKKDDDEKVGSQEKKKGYSWSFDQEVDDLINKELQGSLN